MNKLKPKTKQSMKRTMNKAKQDFPKEELSYVDALRYFEDIIEAASLPVILWGETANRVYNRQSLIGLTKLEFAVTERSLSKYALDTLKLRIGERWQKSKYKDFEIEINLIKNDKGFLKRPDTVGFWGGIFKVPNPFKKFWEMRHLIK